MKRPLRGIVLVEGSDAAGKTTTVVALAERLGAKARIVRLPRPSDEELRGSPFERYLRHLPPPGEIVLFDRSWYGRAGVERVMGFASPQEVESFLNATPQFEADLLRQHDVRLVKLYLEVGVREQAARLARRKVLTPVDAVALERATDYARAAHEMRLRTSTAHAPWHVVSSDGDAQTTQDLAWAHVQAGLGGLVGGVDGEGPWMETQKERCSSGSGSSTNEGESSG